MFNFNLETKRKVWGFIFISPFIIGSILFFIAPLIQTVIYSLSEIDFSPAGYTLEYIGLDNYNEIFLVQMFFVQNISDLVINSLTNLPLIILFSFFVANLLNQKFKGRFLARVIFFLPVIITGEAIRRLRDVDFLSNIMEIEEGVEQIALSHSVRSFLLNLQLPEDFLNYFIGAVDRLPQVINASAIPIIIFLAGLQSIPNSLFEAALIDGATGWEKFWKVTFPLITPLILVNTVYILIDFFFVGLPGGNVGFGVEAAMGISYFLTLTIILSIIYKLISRWVFYHE